MTQNQPPQGKQKDRLAAMRAEALRENLMKRKQQARARKADTKKEKE